MRGITDETAQPCLGRSAFTECLLDLLQHLVQREPEPADFGGLVSSLDPAGKVTGRDCRGRLLHLLQRTESELDDPPREERQRNQHSCRDRELDEQQMVKGRVDLAH